MNLLYVSCHNVLEYDELKLFHELGINVFSHGGYVDPQDVGDAVCHRPPLDIPFYPDLCKLARQCPKEALDMGLIEWADVIVFMGILEWTIANWSRFGEAVKRGNKRVIWRSIGQSSGALEAGLAQFSAQGLEIVRHSNAERDTPGYVEGWPLIRFYKNPDEFCGWTGEEARIISVGQWVKHRDSYCGFTWFQNATEGLDRMIIGPHNAEIDTMPSAVLPYDQLKEALRKNRAFFYTGTYPAPYTLGFVEAFMMGIPVVAIGPKLRNWHFGQGNEWYEIPSLIVNGSSGFWSDNMHDLQEACKRLIGDYEWAKHMGQHGREVAIREFGKPTIKELWRQFLLEDKAR